MTAPPHPASSFLREDIDTFVSVKRALGFRYEEAEFVLLDLDRYVARFAAEATDLSLPVLAGWLAERPKAGPRTRADRLSVVRQLCLFRLRHDASAYVPDRVRCWTIWPSRFPRFRPHIFTTTEVAALLRAAGDLPPLREEPHRPHAIQTILALLYVTGMRISEALALREADIDWEAGTLLVQQTKFYKTRLLPVPAETLARLRAYRERLPSRQGRARPFFRRPNDRAFTAGVVRAAFHQCLVACGPPLLPQHTRPRLHDLRHTFAVTRLAVWYAAGVDVQNRLAHLATYMGHKNIQSTQYYLQITAEVLELASDRFERAFEQARLPRES